MLVVGIRHTALEKQDECYSNTQHRSHYVAVLYGHNSGKRYAHTGYNINISHNLVVLVGRQYRISPVQLIRL